MSNRPNDFYGQYGGEVIRPFKGDGKGWLAGAILSPEEVESWPVANRRALERTGNIVWFGPPVQAEEIVRRAGVEKKAPAEPKAPKADAPKKSNRTK